MKKMLFIIVLVFCSLFILYERRPEYQNITEDDVVYVDVTFDYYDYDETKIKYSTYVVKDAFCFLDYMRLPICYSAVGDEDTFKETFFNMPSGTKMHIGYLKSNLEIIEIHVGDVEYLTLEKSLARIKELEKFSLYFSLLVSPITLVIIFFFVQLVNTPE